NASMNKYNTAHASTVGFQSVNAFAGAGALNFTHDGGGQNTSLHGSMVSASQQLQQGLSAQMQESISVKESLSRLMENSNSVSEALSKARSELTGAELSRVEQHLTSVGEQTGYSESTGARSSQEESASHNRNTSTENA